MVPEFNTVLFTDIWQTAEEFTTDYSGSALSGGISDTNCNKLYYLLYAKFGNNPIRNMDINQFAYKVWAIIFNYGPTWQKRLEIQNNIRALTEEDLLKGSKAIYNHAFNPSSDPGVGEDGLPLELDFINEQNTTNYKRSKIEAYQLQWDLMRTDVTEAFLNNFKNLFRKIVSPDEVYLYETEEDN